MTFEIVKKNYERGLWNEAQVRKAYEKFVITKEQLQQILKSK